MYEGRLQKTGTDEKARFSAERKALITACDGCLRLLRTEAGLSQECMAQELGISKKTLVEIEKGRSSLGWTGCAALCLIFGECHTLFSALGGVPSDTVRSASALSLRAAVPKKEALGSEELKADQKNPLWRQVAAFGDLRAEQNIISEHYRLINSDGERMFASFDFSELECEAKRLASAFEGKKTAKDGEVKIE